MNIIINTSASVSRKHASMRIDSTGNAFVDDISGKAGVYINGKRETNYQLTNGDHIFIMGTSLVYYTSMLLIPSNITVNGIGLKEHIATVIPNKEKIDSLYVRTPRIQKPWIEIL